MTSFRVVKMTFDVVWKSLKNSAHSCYISLMICWTVTYVLGKVFPRIQQHLSFPIAEVFRSGSSVSEGVAQQAAPNFRVRGIEVLTASRGGVLRSIWATVRFISGMLIQSGASSVVHMQRDCVLTSLCRSFQVYLLFDRCMGYFNASSILCSFAASAVMNSVIIEATRQMLLGTTSTATALHATPKSWVLKLLGAIGRSLFCLHTDSLQYAMYFLNFPTFAEADQELNGTFSPSTSGVAASAPSTALPPRANFILSLTVGGQGIIDALAGFCFVTHDHMSMHNAGAKIPLLVRLLILYVSHVTSPGQWKKVIREHVALQEDQFCPRSPPRFSLTNVLLRFGYWFVQHSPSEAVQQQGTARGRSGSEAVVIPLDMGYFISLWNSLGFFAAGATSGALFLCTRYAFLSLIRKFHCENALWLSYFGFPQMPLSVPSALQEMLLDDLKDAIHAQKRLVAESSVDASDKKHRALIQIEDDDIDLCFCPITQSIMADPVDTVDGHTYERAAITEWLVENQTSPVTNLKLEDVRLTPNIRVRQILQRIITVFE